MTKSTDDLCRSHTIFATVSVSCLFRIHLHMGYLLTLMVTLNLNSFVIAEYPLFLGYPVIAGYCLINDMSEYKCTFSQESFSVVAFWQELIYDIDNLAFCSLLWLQIILPSDNSSLIWRFSSARSFSINFRSSPEYCCFSIQWKSL